MTFPARFTWRPAPWMAGWILLLAVLAAFQNSLNGPFVFDDLQSIVDNATIRQVWPPGPALRPPGGDGITVEGRPVLNFSLALNYALSGVEPWSYHLANLAIHAGAALLLLGVVRRTLRRQAPGADPLWTALSIALLWALHPLQTSAVTYVIQRAESLMGFFYLLTLYGFVRGAEADETVGKPTGWLTVSVIACAAGMATKEVMVSAPLLVFAYDRIFVSGSWSVAWQKRRGYYTALAATWLLLALLLVGMDATRGGTAGLGTVVPWWRYAGVQCEAVMHYLRLCFWPVPLVFDYGTALAVGSPLVWLQALTLAGLLAGTAVALWRGFAAGWLGLWFFAILAPSSSVVPVVTQTMAEHRMYLPLAAVTVVTVLALRTLCGRRGLWIAFAAAVALGFATRARNEIYQSALGLHQHTVRNRPGNPRAHLNLGIAWEKLGQNSAAMACYREALGLDPAYADAHNNLGNLLFQQGDTAAALAHYQAALRADPGFVSVHYNLARVWFETGANAEAIAEFRKALHYSPDNAFAHNGLGAALLRAGQPAEAAAEFERTLRLQPDQADAHNNLGTLMLQTGRLDEARAHFEAVLSARPGHQDARYNLGTTLLQKNDIAGAIRCFTQNLARHPSDARSHNNLGVALFQAGRLDEAIRQCEEAVRLDPGYAEARDNLSSLRNSRDTQAPAP